MSIFKDFKFLVLCLIILYQAGITQKTFASDSTFKGYITNKLYNPIKLRVFEINEESFYLNEKNLEDNSYIPQLNLKVVAENTLDYSLTLGKTNVFIPELTKLTGYISEIEPPKKFNRKGYFKVTFDKAICPDGKEINLDDNIISASQDTTYNPLRHIGKTALGLVGGSIAGALFSYQLGGLGLAIATQGYSLAAGAGVGGFVGTIGGFTGNGKSASIEPGAELTIAPIDDASVIQLKQIRCETPNIAKQGVEDKQIKIEILSVKEKKYFLGDNILEVNIKLTNNSSDIYKLNNFFLRDSQGKEYTTSFIDLNEDVFKSFPPNETKTATLSFYIDYPKASHWLVLKDRNFSKEIDSWKLQI